MGQHGYYYYAIAVVIC